MSPLESAGHRWGRLVSARMQQIEQISGGEVQVGPDFWDRSAKRIATRNPATADRDPLVRRVRRLVGRRTVVLDVGAGWGRMSLALAPRAAEVIAVDVSTGMLDVLRRRATELGASNVRTVHGRWEDVGPVVADVAICSYVLPLVEDAAGFLTKLTQATRRRAFLYLGAGGAEALLDPIWRYFHTDPREPAPTYLDAVAVLREIGVDPDVEVVEVRTTSRFETLDEAVDDYRRTLLLPSTDEARNDLRPLLQSWLVRRDGRLAVPARTMPAAIISWVGGHGRSRVV